MEILMDAKRSDCVNSGTRTANTFACFGANVCPVFRTNGHGPTHVVGRVSERERGAALGRRRVPRICTIA